MKVRSLAAKIALLCFATLHIGCASHPSTIRNPASSEVDVHEIDQTGSWKDARGVTWYPALALSQKMRLDEATEECKKLHLVLPSNADFSKADTEGLRKAFPDFKDRIFVTSDTTDLGEPVEGHFTFDGNTGYIIWNWAFPRALHGAEATYDVRCIKR